MKRRTLVLILVVSTFFIFSITGTALAAGWLTPEWYAQYHQTHPAPGPEPAPLPEPTPDPAPQPDPAPGIGTSMGWLSPQWYEKYYGNQPTAPAPTPEPAPGKPGQPDDGSSGLTTQEQRMLDLINAERTKRGLSPVQLDMGITEAARLKSQDMVDNNYFAHVSPTYGRVTDMLDAVGEDYKMAGDILAKTRSVDRALALYMGSPVHRMHLLHPDYTHVGVGVVPNGSGVMVSVFFVKR